MATLGTLAFVSAGPVLMVLDVEDPGDPVALAEITLPGKIRDLTVDENIVVAALGRRGVAVVDVALPGNPLVIQLIQVEGFAEAVASQSSRLAVVEASGYFEDSWKLSFFDLADPSLPVHLGDFNEPDNGPAGPHAEITVDHGFAYWLVGDSILAIEIDAVPGPQLAQVHRFQSCLYQYCAAVDISSSAGWVYASLNWQSDDLSEKRAEFHVLRRTPTGAITPTGLWVEDDAYWGGSDALDGIAAIYRFPSVKILSLLDPQHPQPVGVLSAESFVPSRGLRLGEGFLLGSDLDLQIAGISNPWDPAWESTIDTADSVTAVTVADRHGFVFTELDGDSPRPSLHVLDLNVPEHPIEIAQQTFGDDSVLDTTFVNDRLVTITRGDRLVTYDVSDPRSPVVESQLEIPGDRYLAGNHLAAGVDTVYALWSGYPVASDFVSVIDFSDPSNPLVVIEIAVDACSRGVNRDNNTLAVFTCRGMWLFDIMEPLAPELLSVVEGFDPTLRSGALVESAAYLGDLEGLHVFDTSNPEWPQEVGFVPTPDPVQQVFSTPGLLWVALDEYWQGDPGDLHIFDIRNPLAPERLSVSLDPRGVSDVFEVGSHFLVNSDTEGLEVFSTRCTTQAQQSIPSAEVD